MWGGHKRSCHEARDLVRPLQLCIALRTGGKGRMLSDVCHDLQRSLRILTLRILALNIPSAGRAARVALFVIRTRLALCTCTRRVCSLPCSRAGAEASSAGRAKYLCSSRCSACTCTRPVD
eukprot:1175599-Prorocentrum_minimum.AAC.4